MDWLKINEQTKENDMEWTKLNIEEIPCRFNKDDIIPIEKLARNIHAYKTFFKGPPRDTVDSCLFRAAHNLHHAIDQRANCIESREKGESLIRQAYNLKSKDLSFWQRAARYEIDRIADDDAQCNFLIRELLRIITNMERYLVTSQKCLDLRINNLDIISDHINTCLENERSFLQEALKDLKSKVEELEKRLEKLRSIRPYVQKDVQHKTVSASINQSCDHSDRLLLYRDPPDVTTEPVKFQRLDLKLWEDNANTLLKTSMEIREACQNSCRSAEDMMQKLKNQLFELWNTTKNSLSAEIEKYNDRLDRVRSELTAILYDIQLADQRLLSLRRSGFQENHPLQLNLWRQQREYLKHPREITNDKCNERVDDDLHSSDMRIAWIERDIRRNEDLRENLHGKRCLLEKRLDMINKHLFIDRECCEGLRRSVEQSHPTESFAKRERFHPTPFPWRWHILTKGTSCCVCY